MSGQGRGRGRGQNPTGRGGGQGHGGRGGGGDGRPQGRPGDWDCRECGKTGNFASKSECYKCGAPKSGGGSGSSSQSGSGGPKKDSRPGDWDCPKCGFRGNFANKSDCHKCKAPKPGASGGDGASSSGGSRPPSQQQQQYSGGARSFPPRGGGGGRGGRQSTSFVNRGDIACLANLAAIINSSEGKKKYLGWKKSFISDGDKVKLDNEEAIKNLPPNQLPTRRPPESNYKQNVSHFLHLVVNHVPVTIKLPKDIYQYRIDIDRVPVEKKKDDDSKQKKKPPGKGKPGGGGGAGGGAGPPKMLPATLRKTILMHVIPQLNGELPGHGIMTDFSAALYSVKIFPDREIKVDGGVALGPEEQGREFLVKITQTEEHIDTSQDVPIDINNMGIDLADIWKEVNPNLKILEKVYSTLMRNLLLNTYTPMRRADLIEFGHEPHYLGGGVVSYPGYNVMLPIANGWKKFINIEIANLAAYMSGPVMAVIQDVLGRNRPATDVTKWGRGDFKKVNDVLKTCKVKYSPQSNSTYSKVVAGLCQKSVSEIMFDWEQNGRTKKVSVAQYFDQHYGIRVQNRNGPCLELKGGMKPKVPAEICTMKDGQSYNRKLDDNQVREIAKKAKKPPGELRDAIALAYQDLQMKNNDLLNTYGVSFPTGGKMHEIKKARVLTPPRLVHGKAFGTNNDSKLGCITPDNGQWDLFQTNFEFFTPESVKKMGILNLSECYKEQTEDFVKRLREKAKGRGIDFAPPCHYDSLFYEKKVYNDPDSRDHNFKAMTASLREFKKKFVDDNGNFEPKSFILVFLPAKNCSLYHHIKQAAEMEVGLLTQCIVESNTGNRARNLDSIVGNILLKINSKLTGTNYLVLPPPEFPKSFTIFDIPVMIIGADVTHPPPGSGTKREVDGKLVDVYPPSFAAVTASIDRTGMPYMVHIEAQSKPKAGAAEVITNLEAIMKKFLMRYYMQTRKQYKPVKIIYFRDGVGDSQFEEVLRTEMSAIRRACTNLQADYEPKITFITVQKRHKTRFFIKDSNDNAPAGTIVDSDIVHPTQTDFYLLSHRGLMGTSRPTRYHVLWDDSDFCQEEIQTLAYFLCYMFVRCNKSVKIPAPTYYAHWGCARADALARGWAEQLYHDIPALNAKLWTRETQNDFAKNYPMHFV